MFTLPFIQAQIKENVKAPRRWPLCRKFTSEFPAQMASNMENVCIWWHHHAFLYRLHSLIVVSFCISRPKWTYILILWKLYVCVWNINVCKCRVSEIKYLLNDCVCYYFHWKIGHTAIQPGPCMDSSWYIQVKIKNKNREELYFFTR